MLTWPQGNGWLVAKLKEQSTGPVLTQSLAYAVKIADGTVQVDYFDANENKTKRIVAGKVIVASPQFIAQRLLSPDVNRHVDYTAFNYAPWMIANLTMAGNFNDKRGESLCWDNVIYGSNSLGYVDACHQQLDQHIDRRVLTYYMPLTSAEPKDERQRAHGKGYDSWQQLVLADLKSPHPHLAEHLEAMDIWIWGHGMIRPSTGFITGPDALNAKSPIDNRIFFAHSDLSGISIFEEAFYRGTLAAEKLIAS